jgi:hypothetical protein
MLRNELYHIRVSYSNNKNKNLGGWRLATIMNQCHLATDWFSSIGGVAAGRGGLPKVEGSRAEVEDRKICKVFTVVQYIGQLLKPPEIWKFCYLRSALCYLRTWVSPQP